MTNAESVEARIAALEARIAALERRLAAATAPDAEGRGVAPETPQPPATPPVVGYAPLPTPAPSSLDAPLPPIPLPSLRAPGISAALVLGWAGAAALVLAAAYLVRLGIEYGWITPARQILAATGLGALMVLGGLGLRLTDRRYASLLGAGGVAVLYLADFGAHLYHHLIDAPAAMAFAVAISGISLAFHALYRTGIYVAFAMAGSYATPLLLEGRGSVGDLALYLGVWDLVYCAYGVWIGRRIVVVGALYASLVVFDIAWAEYGRGDWELAALFQLFQFVLFVSVAVAIAVRTRKPMDAATAVLQFPALLLFYAFEYVILETNAPDLAPWAAVGFALALYAAWTTARALVPERPRASLVTIHAFGALVLFHAIYIDALSAAWRPLAGLALATALVLVPRLRPGLRNSWWPYWIVAGVLVLAGWIELSSRWGSGVVVGEVPLALLYPAAFYALYFERPVGTDPGPRALALAVAHVLLLADTAYLVERWFGAPETTVDRFWLSIAWALIGVVALAVALLRKDRLLARSTLAIFLLFGFKVMMIDLERASPLVRVGILAVLGVSLYAGGWIYRRVLPPPASD